MRTVTQKDAKELWCPIIDKPCLGLNCMMFNHIGRKSELDEDGATFFVYYVCGMNNE